MVTFCNSNLQEIKHLIGAINLDQYTHSSSLLSGASIGQHIRHILEFYICLIKGYNIGIVNYDQRERDFKIENDLAFAIETIDKVCSKLIHSNEDLEIMLQGNYGSFEGKSNNIKTSFKRELAYCLEHSIHHQALIKIGLIELNISNRISEEFGVAPATIRHKSMSF